MSTETEIRTLIEDWARAVAAGDRQAIIARHSRDLLMFDFPDTKTGIDAYDKQWDYFFEDPKGPISFVPRDIAVTGGADVAFATCVVACNGTSAGPVEFRLTTVLRKIDGTWTITHEHHSVPTVEQRFLGG